MRSVIIAALLMLACVEARAQGYYDGVVLEAMTDEPDRLVRIRTKHGTIKLQLFERQAPNTVAAFLRMVEDGFYDGMTFHRVRPGIFIQTGDPLSKDDTLENDGRVIRKVPTAPADGNWLQHHRSIVSMAVKGGMSEANSQFFIMLDRVEMLDHRHTIFGQVVEGMDVVEKISELPKLSGENPGKESAIIDVSVIRDKKYSFKSQAKTE
jgi:cyclophilin family peptidyl-prolyl cis-trans isomerase